MATSLVDWTLAHLRLMWAFVGLTFVGMLFVPDARWNAITTVWGALFLGLLISLVLEQRGEGIQRRAWLRQNAERARKTVDELLAVAVGAYSAAFAVDLPAETMQALIAGPTREARRAAAAQARAHIVTQVAQIQYALSPADANTIPAEDLLAYAPRAREVRERNGVVLSRATQLDRALERLLDALRWYQESHAERTYMFLLPIGEAAVGLCEACADLLVEARMLPPW